MAAMLLALTEYSDKENARTYTVSGHTVQKPKLVFQKRKNGSEGGPSASDTITLVYGTEDSAGDPLASRVVFEVTVRRPVEGIAADVTAALADFRDVIAGDEFANTVNTQNYLK